MRLVGELAIELAVLPIGDNFTMGPDDALRSLEYLEPNLVLPIHYDTFPPKRQDARRFVDRASRLGIRGKVLQPGGDMTV